MKYIKLHFSIILGFLITLLYLFLNLVIINDYGVTWDFTYHFNAGLWHLKHTLSDSNFVMGPSPPLSDILPTISYLFFHEKLHLLSFDAAYNLYSVVIGSLGIGILYFMIKDLFNWQIAFFSSLTLAFLPRYFGHLHNNMKDIPQAVAFTLALWLFWRFMKKPKLTNLILACFAFALSLNSKVNAIFILLTAAIYLLINVILSKMKNPVRILNYFIFAPLAAFLLWLPFWDNPIGRLLEASHSYTTSTTNMPILYFGRIFYSGNNVPWHYPLGLLGVTTPVLTLFFVLIGFIYTLINIRSLKSYFLLLIWFIVPFSRYLKPHIIVIDDIRHFMELLFPLAVFGGLGAWFIYERLISKNKLSKSIFLLFSIFYFLFSILEYHPYQTSYFNELIGGINGARDKFDIDFWASSYKQTMQYLNKNAKSEAKIIVAMAPDIAKLYLRSDLLPKLNLQNMTHVDAKIYSQSDYAVILNRQSFFQWYSIYPYIKERKPIYSLTLHSVPLVSIYQN